MAGHKPFPPCKPGYFRIWFVKDAMSGHCLDGCYFSEKQEAVDARNAYGYGYVSYHELKDHSV